MHIKQKLNSKKSCTHAIYLIFTVCKNCIYVLNISKVYFGNLLKNRLDLNIIYNAVKNIIDKII